MCDYCGCRTIPLIADLGRDHERLLDLGDRARRAIAAGDEARAAESFDELVRLLELHDHIEEVSLFAALRDEGELLAEVDALTSDHRMLAEAVDDAARLDGRQWTAAVEAVVATLERHIGREEFDIFPAAVVCDRSVELGPRRSGRDASESGARRLISGDGELPRFSPE